MVCFGEKSVFVFFIDMFDDDKILFLLHYLVIVGMLYKM